MGVRDGHAVSSAAHYQASSIHGLPRIAELFVLAYRVYHHQDTHAFVKVWFVENQQRWKRVVQLFGDKFPHLRSNKEIGQALMADEVKGSPFIKLISEVLEGKSESLSPQQAKFIRPLLSSYRKESLERMMPLIEALFMTARGHNAELENPTETDRPACANGLQLQLLKAIAESKVAGAGATGLLAGVTIEACDVPLADASASSAAAASSSSAAASSSSGSDSDQANSGAGRDAVAHQTGRIVTAAGSASVTDEEAASASSQTSPESLAELFIIDAKKRMDAFERFRTVKAIRDIPADQRAAVLAAARTLITEGMDGFESAKIIGVIGRIPDGEKAARVKQAHALLEARGEGAENIDLIIQSLNKPLPKAAASSADASASSAAAASSSSGSDSDQANSGAGGGV